jgi:hypothetical protein
MTKLPFEEEYFPHETTFSRGAGTKRTSPEIQQPAVSFFWDLGKSFG